VQFLQGPALSAPVAPASPSERAARGCRACAASTSRLRDRPPCSKNATAQHGEADMNSSPGGATLNLPSDARARQRMRSSAHPARPKLAPAALVGHPAARSINAFFGFGVGGNDQSPRWPWPTRPCASPGRCWRTGDPTRPITSASAPARAAGSSGCAALAAAG
jgi:hypothetical protein